MPEDLLDDVYEGRVHTIKTIVISAFFGGILAAGIMMYQNFKTFGDRKKANTTIALTIIGLIALMSTAFIPALDKIPGILYSAIATLITSFLAKKYQEKIISQHIKNEGKTYTAGKAVLICFISIVLIFAFLFGIFLLQDAALENQ